MKNHDTPETPLAKKYREMSSEAAQSRTRHDIEQEGVTMAVAEFLARGLTAKPAVEYEAAPRPRRK